MNPGAVLVGLAAAVVTIAYIARPFRNLPAVDREIEAWLAAIRSGSESPASEGPSGVSQDGVEVVKATAPGAEALRPAKQESDITFCYQCGRPIRPHHRFCPRCGVDLRESEV